MDTYLSYLIKVAVKGRQFCARLTTRVWGCSGLKSPFSDKPERGFYVVCYGLVRPIIHNPFRIHMPILIVACRNSFYPHDSISQTVHSEFLVKILFVNSKEKVSPGSRHVRTRRRILSHWPDDDDFLQVLNTYAKIFAHRLNKFIDTISTDSFAEPDENLRKPFVPCYATHDNLL